MDENGTGLLDPNTNHIGFLDYSTRGFTTSEIILMVIMFLSALAGVARNLTVMALISTGRRLHTVTNMFLFQRAAAEIMVMSAGAYWMVTRVRGGFPIGYAMCYIQPIHVQAVKFVSLVFLVLLTVDSYLVSRPKHHSLQYRWKTMKVGSSVTWAVGLALALPYDIFYGHIREEDRDSNCTKDPFMSTSHNATLRFVSEYCKHVVPVIVAWVYVCFSFPSVSSEVTETETLESGDGESEESVASLRSLSLVLIISVTVCQIPYRISIEMSYLFYNYYLTIVLFAISEIHYALNPFLYILYRKDLWQKLKSCRLFHFRSSTSSRPFENL